jgi:hypothetical protein
LTRRVRMTGIIALIVLSVAALGAYTVFRSSMPGARAADAPLPLPVTHQHFNFFQPVTDGTGDGAANPGTYRNPSSPICSTTTSSASNVNTDCEGTAPHNETSVAVDPTNASHMIGSANDYELAISSGGTTYETAYSRAHVTFDGGQTWTTYPINYNSYVSTGDPAVAFDAAGNAYLATLGFLWSQGNGCCVNPDVLVAHSNDGGKTWANPSRVASGSGSFGSVGVFNDKEYITAWGNGNAIVTWTVFNDGLRGSYISSPIDAAVTHDGGKTWTAGVEISGSASFCVGAQGGNTCNQDQVSVPVVAKDGSIYVSFESTADNATGRDEYLIVKVDPATGQRVAGPYKVAGLYDGFTDYPINIDGRQTYQDSQFRSWSAGNIAADPTDASHLAVVWSDMRNSTLPAPNNPYTAKTNSDVVVSQSSDGGATWSAPVAIQAAGDQFMPWAAYDASGKLRIGYFDRSYDPANHKFGYTLATETTAGSLSFSFTQVTSALSDPTQGDRWFAGRTPNSAYPHPTTFLGDYSGIAAGSSGVVSLWTDMRTPVCFTVRCGSSEDAFFGASS